MAANAVPQYGICAVQTDSIDLELRKRQTPKPASSQVLVRLRACGVCATDLHLSRRTIPWLQPSVDTGGHEGAGDIVQLGPDVDKTLWNIGDRVAVRWLYSVCLECELCTTGYENLCSNRRLTGKDVGGCFAQYVVAESKYLNRLPEGVGYVEAAPILCAGVTVYKALKVANLRRGSWVVISGAGGGLGHLGIQYARVMGFKVVAVDFNKRDFCTELGSEVYIDVTEENLVGQVVKATGGGGHAAIVCASAGQAYVDAVKYLRKSGTMVCVGVPEKQTQIPVTPEDFIARGIRIVGTSTGSREDVDEALRYVASKQVKTNLVVRPLEDVDAVLKEIELGRSQGKTVLTIAGEETSVKGHL